MHFRYSKNLNSAKASGIRKGIYGGRGMGFFFFVMFGSYALAFWYGGKLVREEDYTPGRMMTVSISLQITWRNFNMHNSLASFVASIHYLLIAGKAFCSIYGVTSMLWYLRLHRSAAVL